MNRLRIFLILAIALTAGAALAYGTYNYLQTMPVKTVSVPTRGVVVAAADLSLGAELRADDLAVLRWPLDGVPEGAFANTNEIVGRGLIASVVKGEPILPGKLASTEAGTGLPPIIPPGMRAVSVRVNEVVGVAGYVLPGTHVDVIATASPNDEREETTSKVVLSNVQVLAAGTRIEQDQDKGKPVQVTVVTLLVTPQEAERLALAHTEGKIQLALRNPLDQDEPETTGVKPAMLLRATPASPTPAPRPAVRPRPAPPPAPVVPAPPTVEVIRGDKRTNEVVR